MTAVQPFMRSLTKTMIYHLTSRQAWVEAQSRGEYRAESLETEGFIHCSTLPQVLKSANKFFGGQTGLLLLWIDSEKVESEIKYELAAGDIAAARRRLDTLAGFANDGLMIPEQVWDREESPTPELRFGAGTGSATPLAWSMAQFIRLAMSIERGRNMETPKVVWERYGGRG